VANREIANNTLKKSNTKLFYLKSNQIMVCPQMTSVHHLEGEGYLLIPKLSNTQCGFSRFPHAGEEAPKSW
jgi:hypothetical protein